MKKRTILTIIADVIFLIVLGWMIYYHRLTGIIECGAPFCSTNPVKFILLLNVLELPAWILFLIALKMKMREKKKHGKR